MSAQEQFGCPYCDAAINVGALSCRSCGRDLTPVLPLLRRLDALESRLAAIEEVRLAEQASPLAVTEAGVEPDGEAHAEPTSESPERRRFWALPVGLLVLLAVYWVVVLWLDLPLAALRLSSIVIPFITGAIYFARRSRMSWFDGTVAILFAATSVASMNALLGWIDSVPFTPQGAAAWRETLFYMFSIAASMLSGMLLRLSQTALSARGLTSIPKLRDGLLAANGKVPMDTLKAIELTILMVSTAVTAIAGLLAGLLGVTR